MDITLTQFEQESKIFISKAKRCIGGKYRFTIRYHDTDIDVMATDKFVLSCSPVSPERNKLGYLYLRGFYIDKKHRGKNLGTWTINYLVDQCRINNVPYIEVEPYQQSIEFFKKNGFVEVENKYSTDLRMRLNVFNHE